MWDFPDGLYRREVAAYELSLALGWDVVPTTVVRDGPFDEGSVQIFVDADFEEHYFTLASEPDFRTQLLRICLFDLLANNTDRKGGHCLLGTDGHIWAIDNALCFHAEFKLRTVIWDFAGEPIPDDLLGDVRALLDRGLPPAFDELLDPFERDAVLARGEALTSERHFPHDPSGRRYPWPIV
ncbi:MAG: SCO1664 family protein [Acidimicrobiia bacterium]|nr:SCO1664 family protein [Acidimicrobiia bacterium]